MLKIPYQKLRLSSKGNLKKYILQGIPVLSIFAFLGILSMMISLDSSGLVGFDISNKAYAEEPITPYATTATASLSIGGAGETEQVVAGRGTVTYRAHTVTLNASNIESYTLTIAGNTNMTGAGTVSGANNTTGTNMLDNTWGYSYGETTTQDKMTYKAPSTTGTTIDTGTPSSHSITNLTKNLVFAVKFGEDIPQGRYYTNVKLSLTVTSKQLAGLSTVATLQEVTTEICANTPVGDTQYTLKDARDNNTYTVAKLADGNCWMTQNLRLTGSRTLTPATSSVYANYTLPSSVSSLTNNFALRVGNYTAQVYYPGNTTNGAYYSWTAATAGTGNQGLVSGNAPADICPKNWRLPVSSGNRSFDQLATAYDARTNPIALQQAPLKFVIAGAAYDGKMDTTMGRYWTRTAYDSTNAYYMKFNNTSASPINAYDRFGGASIRCVADDTPVNDDTPLKSFGNISTMQEMTTSICSNESVGATTTLTDNRDGKSYTIRKHEDGNCWMTQNLSLVGSRTLTSSNSDVTSSYTLPASNLASFTESDTAQAVYLSSTSNGAYYSWCAATAGTCGSTAASSTAASSICPKGWKLPASTGNKSFDALLTATGSSSATLRNSTYNFNLAGRAYNNAVNYIGERGYWWSSSSSNVANDAYSLYLTTSSTNSRYGHDWRTGYSVRCVAK